MRQKQKFFTGLKNTSALIDEYRTKELLV